jgi:cyclophilin family peptidyl-prolyl cis-trans isomerase/protein-disulfide isomerase
MRKLWFFVVLTAAVLLSACTQSSTPESPASAGGGSNLQAVAPTENVALPKMECNVISLLPTPGPTEVSLFPPPSADDWVMGGNNPAMTITEYSDFQCPYCAQFSSIVKDLAEKYPEDVQVVFRHFPLPSHPLGLISAYASEAAGRQGKFWEMENRIFSAQSAWSGFTEEQFKQWAVAQAKDLGLDTNQFSADLQDQAIIEKVMAAQQYAMDVQIPGTPFVLINGRQYDGPRDPASLEAIVQLLRLEDRQVTYCPPMQINPAKQYIATLKTVKGDVKLQLFADKAPMAVNSFVFLAENGWFNNITFHRVMPNFVAQAGDPSGTGYGGPGYTFNNEISDLKFNKEGLLAMANAGPGSNGSQFFITYGPAANLDGGYTIFGEVIEGMDVVKQLTPRDPQQGELPPGDAILTVTIEEK